MKTAALLCLAIFATGCSSIRGYKGEEFHSSLSFPGFSHQVDALGIKRTATKATVTELRTTTSVMGVSYDVQAKNVEVTIRKDPAP